MNRTERKVVELFHATIEQLERSGDNAILTWPSPSPVSDKVHQVITAAARWEIARRRAERALEDRRRFAEFEAGIRERVRAELEAEGRLPRPASPEIHPNIPAHLLERSRAARQKAESRTG